MATGVARDMSTGARAPPGLRVEPPLLTPQVKTEVRSPKQSHNQSDLINFESSALAK